MHFLQRNSLLKEGLRVKEKAMIVWIHQQEEREKLRAEKARQLQKNHLNLKVIKDQDDKKPQDQVDKKPRNRRQKPQRRAKKNQQEKRKNNVRNQEQGLPKEVHNRTQENHPKEKPHPAPQEEHHQQDHYASSLISSTWSLLRRVMTAPPLARHMVQMIARRLSQSLTLCEQPHFDLALMQTPSSSSSSICSPPSEHLLPPIDATG